MRFSRDHLRSLCASAAVFPALVFAGCGNTCVAGFSINGNGGVVVKAGDPPPTCSLAQAKGAITAMVAKSPRCESCSSSANVDHIFVTVSSLQLRPSASADSRTDDWLELAPNLEGDPRQFDLIGESAPVILAESSLVPAGSYLDLRLQFLSGSPTYAQTFPAQNACGDKGWNCLVFADGRVEPLRFFGDTSELLILTTGTDNNSLLVLPDARLALRLGLEVHQELHYSNAEGWTMRSRLSGRAKTFRQASFLPESSSTEVQ